MSTKTIANTYISGGYTLSPSYAALTIASSATIGGSGLTAAGAASVDNEGTITAGTVGTAVQLSDGGVLQNGSAGNDLARVSADKGVDIAGAAGTVLNYGVISGSGLAAVELDDGGSVTSGSLADTGAVLQGGLGVVVTAGSGAVTNFGTISGSAGGGVSFAGAGRVVSGGTADTVALIEGSTGVATGAGGSGLGTVVNYGTIRGTSAGGFGVALYAGGTLTNGTASDPGALIAGGGGVEVEGSSGSIANFGSITGSDQDGLSLSAGGGVSNGSAADAAALISGFDGIISTGSVTVTNFGTILGNSQYGLYASSGGGTITNGSTADTAAAISGPDGVRVVGTAKVTNFGTIAGSTGPGISLVNGGTVTNGSAAVTTALIHGYGEAVVADGPVSLTNFGTVSAGYGTAAVGSLFALYLGGSGGSASITNGGKGDKAALISGFSGVEFGSTVVGTLVNYGEVEGTGGVALNFQSAKDVLVLEAGTSFDGEALGGGGELILDRLGGAGTVANLGSYTGFSTIDLVAGAAWTLSQNGSIGVGTTLTDAGRLTNLATLTLEGSPVTVAGTGVLVNGSSADATALISGTVGVLLAAGGTVVNFGTISGTGNAIQLPAGDTNQVPAGAPATATVTNFGTILGGGTYAAILSNATVGSVSVVNGSATDTAARIQGNGLSFAGSATIGNFGTIQSTTNYHYAIEAVGAARITNGSAADTTALLAGGGEIYLLGGATVTNFGTVNPNYGGIEVTGAAQITNGSATDTTAIIEAGNGASGSGIRLYSGGTVDNFGTVNSGPSDGAVEFALFNSANMGGTVVNGSAKDRVALLEGRYGIDAYSRALGPVTVVNFGTILGTGTANGVGNGVYFAGPSDVLVIEAGSTITGRAFGAGGTLELGAGGGAGTFSSIGNNANYNHFGSYLIQAGGTWTLTGSSKAGSLVDDGMLIDAGTIDAEVEIHGGSVVNESGATLAGTGGAVYGAAGSADRVTNLGVVTAGGFAPGIAFAAGGSVANGSNSDTTALIRSSAAGVEIAGGAGTVTNYGTIAGVLAGWDVVLGQGGTVVNGGLLGTTAVIDGVEVQGAAGKVANFGTIAGGGVAGVALLAGGSVTNGSAASRLALITGGTGVELLGAGTVTNFGTIAATVPGEAALRLGAAQDVLVDEASGVFEGAVIGAGGTLDLAAGAGAGQLANLGSAFAGFATVDVLAGASWTLTGASTIAAGTTLSSTGALILKGTSLVAGALGGTGSVNFDTGTATLSIGAAVTVARWTISGGAVVTDGLASLAYGGAFSGFGSTLALAGHSLTLAGAASFTNLDIASTGTFSTTGKTAVAGLTLAGSVHWLNSGTATETGQIVVGDVGTSVAVVENLAGGVIDIVDTSGISLGGGAGASNLENAGLLEKTGGSGRSMIGVIVANSGTISVAAGTLDLGDAVTGTGGTLDLAKGTELELGGAVASGQTVAFTGTGATLLLDQPSAFKAAVRGFAAGDRIDLAGFVHGTGEAVTYKANAGDTGGTLTVTDGALTASVSLFGQYAAAGFKLAADGHGGSLVAYVPPPASPLAIAAHG